MDEKPDFHQWPSLQQSAYANVAAENVDWASLAQQWIQMRETTYIGEFSGFFLSFSPTD